MKGELEILKSGIGHRASIIDPKSELPALPIGASALRAALPQLQIFDSRCPISRFPTL
jgi:hypothetical protein